MPGRAVVFPSQDPSAHPPSESETVPGTAEAGSESEDETFSTVPGTDTSEDTSVAGPKGPAYPFPVDPNATNVL